MSTPGGVLQDPEQEGLSRTAPLGGEEAGRPPSVAAPLPARHSAARGAWAGSQARASGSRRRLRGPRDARTWCSWLRDSQDGQVARVSLLRQPLGCLTSRETVNLAGHRNAVANKTLSEGSGAIPQLAALHRWPWTHGFLTQTGHGHRGTRHWAKQWGVGGTGTTSRGPCPPGAWGCRGNTAGSKTVHRGGDSLRPFRETGMPSGPRKTLLARSSGCSK